MSRPLSIIVTCEHGGNRVPPRYRDLFHGHEALLHTHRGYDPGALTMARQLAKVLHAPLFISTTSRLLIDLNRSPGHPRLYSEATRFAPAAVRREIFERYYLPYREQVATHIAREIANGRRLIHLSSHSFTPVLDGNVRGADIGLLYDPGRKMERRLCLRCQAKLVASLPGLRVRRNYPYTGVSDGLTAWFRRRFSGARYAGIELEINQYWATQGGAEWRRLRQGVVNAITATLDQPF